MPKLPLDREMLKLLPGVAIDAVRHPRRTASQVVNGSITVVGHLLERRPATEPVPGMVSPPPTDVEPEGGEPPGPVAAEPDAVDDTVEDLAPSAEPLAAPVEPPVQPPVEAPVDAASDEVPDAVPDTVPDTAADEGPSDTRPEGPAPHMRPRIAGDVERDFEEDIPGITGHRER